MEGVGGDEAGVGGDAGLLGAVAGYVDGGLVVVGADEAGLWVGGGHQDGGGGVAAADVGDAGAGLQLGDDAVQGGQPGVDEVGDVAGFEEPFGADEQVRVVFVPAEPVAGGEPVGDGVDVP